MDSTALSVSLSAIDAERFGIQSARASLVTEDTLAPILDFCRANSVVFLIARCDADDIGAVHLMERNGFLLMDTLLHYQCNLTSGPPETSSSPGVTVRAPLPGEEDRVRELATEAFRGYVGHYHADPRLDRVKCDETYASWAYRATTMKEVADHVLVGELNGSLAGFIALKLNSPEEGAFALNAVRPDAQGSGVYSRLVSAGKEWCIDQGAIRVTTSTHLPNRAVQKVWARHGFWLTNAFYTFHKWFDPAE